MENKNDKNELLSALMVPIIIFISLSFMFGVIMSSSEYTECHQRSIVTRYNPAYLLGCELFKHRYEDFNEKS